VVASLADKVERRPGRGAVLCIWVRAILTRHASYLMGVPNLSSKLAGLHNLLSRRVAVFPKLLSLSGRLDLALAQIASQEQGHGRKLAHVAYDEELDESLDLARE